MIRWLERTFKERLRAADLLGAHSNAVLVTFSACLSGLEATLFQCDVEGFPYSILAIGAWLYSSCIGEAKDLVTPLHIYCSYEMLLLAGAKYTRLAYLWHDASLSLFLRDIDLARQALDQIVDI